jgi:hypothetical protein
VQEIAEKKVEAAVEMLVLLYAYTAYVLHILLSEPHYSFGHV